MRLVLADLDNTLVDRAAAFRSWAEEVVRRHRLHTDAVLRLIDADADGQVPRDGVFDLLRELGVNGSPTELHAAYRRDFVAKFELAVEVKTSLARLRHAGCTVVIVSNGPKTQREKIEHTGLDAHVDGCIVSEDVGVRKPDARIFEAAARLAGTALHPRHWMVGDHPTADIGGAAAAGLRSVWLRRGRPWPSADYSPTHTADTFAEAATHILGSAG
jgi:putative hydrolase of the HAD superfamily